jgi:hypothetical protein
LARRITVEFASELSGTLVVLSGCAERDIRDACWRVVNAACKLR